jgi:hypothetical protein
MMKKTFLFVAALLSLAIANGCAKGGNGMVPPPPSVDVEAPQGTNPGEIYTTQSLTITATVSNATGTTVTWSLSGTGCTGSACGTLTPVSPATTPATAIYVAPPTPPSSQVTVTATLTSDTSVAGSLGLTVDDITTDVSPVSLNVGLGLTQQFTAVAVPDDAPQTFTWTCTANGVPCATFVQDPKVSGLAYYTAADSCTGGCIQIAAASTLDPNGCAANPKNCTIAKASLVTFRVNGAYAFRFSGYDSSNHPTAVVGTFTAANGSVISGVEDELTSSGWAQHSITGGSYTPTSTDGNNSNNAGTLTLATGAFPNNFQAVLDGAGDIEMIEIDGHGTGSGIAQKSASPSLFTGDQTFAFGFTGVDAAGGRAGYVGVLPMNGSAVVGGQMDANDNGSATITCGTGPCAVAGSYVADACACGLYHLTLASGSDTSMKFDLFLASGSANKTTPLTFYVISTDPDTNPAVSGTMVLQDSTLTYNNAAFKGVSVSALTGTGPNNANANVSLTLGTTDGNGNFSGSFDQNNNGTIVSVPPLTPFAYTYAASGTAGRYTFQMLGNPTASPVVPPLPFVLYASGATRGFLLDQSSSSVMTGSMNPQGKGNMTFAPSVLPGTYGAATTSSASSAVDAIAANLLLTSVNVGTCTSACVSGTEYDAANSAGVPLAGAYTLQTTGNGTATLTAPKAQSYVIYVVDTSGCSGSSPVCAVQDFFMMDVDQTNPNASIIFAKQ